MRKDVNDSSKGAYLEPGEYVVWRWLALDRFFPVEHRDKMQTVLRGTSADFLESSCFRFVTVYRFDPVDSPYIAPNVSLFQSATHDPVSLATVPGSPSFMLTHIPSLKPRRMLPFDEAFPNVDEITEAAAQTPRRTEFEEEEGSEKEEEEEEEEDLTPLQLKSVAFEPEKLRNASSKVELPQDDQATINSAVMACGGSLIIGAGTGGTVWTWQVPAQQ